MKILMFGGSGQLGHEIRYRALDLNFELIAPVQSELDVSDARQVITLASQVKPDVVINCAAYTAVDKAEEEPELAFAINRDGAGHVAAAAHGAGAKLVHISTDYVFGAVFTGGVSVRSGAPGNPQDDTAASSPRPLTEDDPTGPLNVYGQSKLEGEVATMENTDGAATILRTSSLYGIKGPNFVDTMLKLFSEGKEVKVVSDILMSPTWAGWLAEVVLDVCRVPSKGIFHAANSGGISWFDFAQTILEKSRGNLPQGAAASVVPVSHTEYPRPATRAIYSVLDCSKLANLIGRKPMGWDVGLDCYLQEKFGSV